jgi:hypothetical protein
MPTFLGHDRGLVDVETRVAVIEPDQRQHLEEIDIRARQGVLRPRRIRPPFRGNGKAVPTPDELPDLFLDTGLLGQSQRQGVIGPRAVHVHRDPGTGETGDVVEVQCGRGIAHPRRRVGRRGHIRLGRHLLSDAPQLARFVKGAQETAQVVVRHVDFLRDQTLEALAACMPGQRLASGTGRSS